MSILINISATLAFIGFFSLLKTLWQQYSTSVIFLNSSTRIFHVRSLPYFGAVNFAFDPYEYFHSVRARIPSQEWFCFQFSGVNYNGSLKTTVLIAILSARWSFRTELKQQKQSCSTRHSASDKATQSWYEHSWTLRCMS
jgi:hypothetical protein